MSLKLPGLALVSLVFVAACGSSSSDSSSSSGSSSGAAAPATSFGPPKRKAGESWSTKITTTSTNDQGTDTNTSESTIFVDFAGEGGSYAGRAVPKDGGKSVSLVFDLNGHLVSAGDCSFTPSANVFAYPLEVGKKWAIDFTDCGKARTTGTGEVVARKTVPSALGDVDALEIVLTQTTVRPVLGEDGRTPTGESTSYSWTQRLDWSTREGLTVKGRTEATGLPPGHSAVTEEVLTAYTPGK